MRGCLHEGFRGLLEGCTGDLGFFSSVAERVRACVLAFL